MDDIAIIIVTHDSALWILPCLKSVFAHLGAIRADVVVVDTESRDQSAELVDAGFPQARVVRCRNRGFAYANNQALVTCNARYVLFLNPDTELWQGTIGDLIRAMESREDVGSSAFARSTRRAESTARSDTFRTRSEPSGIQDDQAFPERRPGTR